MVGPFQVIEFQFFELHSLVVSFFAFAFFRWLSALKPVLQLFYFSLIAIILSIDQIYAINSNSNMYQCSRGFLSYVRILCHGRFSLYYKKQCISCFYEYISLFLLCS
jgi:hypothetical protein|uniref:Uncharacterized protein n=1 Tax=Populus trichocarpa TaxID=3694 RepID=A0A2K1ZK00_POPTR